MFVVIVGAGAVGTCLIDIAVREKNNVVVVESSPLRAAEISRNFDVTVLNADATVVETLRDAAASQADALVATTGDDAINLMAVSIAAELGIPSIVSIVNEKGHSSFFRRLGAIVMENPEEIVATHLYNTLKRPASSSTRLFQTEQSSSSSNCMPSLRLSGAACGTPSRRKGSPHLCVLLPLRVSERRKSLART